MSTPLEDWHFYREQLHEYLNKRFVKSDNAWGDDFFEDLYKRRNEMSDLTSDHYDRPLHDEIQMPGRSDQEAYDLLREIAVTMNRWVDQSREGGWSTHQSGAQEELATKIYAFLGRKGK